MLLITIFVELRVVAGRSRTRAGSPQAVSRRSCCAVVLRKTACQSMAWARHGHGIASVNQTQPHCVKHIGKTHSKPLAARHGRGMSWARHAMCESALRNLRAFKSKLFRLFVTWRLPIYTADWIKTVGLSASPHNSRFSYFSVVSQWRTGNIALTDMTLSRQWLWWPLSYIMWCRFDCRYVPTFGGEKIWCSLLISWCRRFWVL